MIWLELRKDNQKYAHGWNFAESAWAPIKKDNGSQWPYWYLLKNVSKGDLIFHLRNIKGNRSFVGYSVASSNGYISHANPTSEHHEWDFSASFYKVDLTDFVAFYSPISLDVFFKTNEVLLRSFFDENRIAGPNKKKLFYVIQNKKLQCQNGAYFSEFTEPLYTLLTDNFGQGGRLGIGTVSETGEIYKNLKQRIGHLEFAENVKTNFGYQCCFPNCEIQGSGFLVSGHISRWADDLESRGITGNGLCLCLIHDRAFENGFFTLDTSFRIKIVEANIGEGHSWILSELRKSENMQIKPRRIDPLEDCLQKHWLRIGYNPLG